MKAVIRNKHVANAFREGLKYLSTTHIDVFADGPTRRCEFFCHALDHACKRDEISDLAREATAQIIYNRVGNSAFATWLVETHPELKEAVEHDSKHNSGRKMQETRKAWVESMITEFDIPGVFTYNDC